MDAAMIDAVRRTYEAFNRGDFDAAVEIAHPEIEFVPPGGQASLRGAAAVRAWMEPDAFEEQQIQPREIRIQGNKALIRQHARARGAGSGIELDLENWAVFTFDDDLLVTRVESFLPHEEAEALEAAGLSELAMSQENVEIVRRGYERFSRTGELDRDRIDADAVFDNSNAVFADPGLYRGLDRIREWIIAQAEMWESQRYEPEEFIPVGVDQVVVPQRIVSVGRDGVEVAAHTANLFKLRGGKVTCWKSFQSKAEALEAAGLQE